MSEAVLLRCGKSVLRTVSQLDRPHDGRIWRVPLSDREPAKLGDTGRDDYESSPRLLVRRPWVIRIVLLWLATLAGASYQAITWHVDDQRLHRPGRLVSAGKLQLNLYCTGQGSPTVVLESGLADSLDTWRHVQPDVALFTRVAPMTAPGTATVIQDRCLEQATGSHRNCTQRSNLPVRNRLIFWSAIRSAASTFGSSMASIRVFGPGRRARSGRRHAGGSVPFAPEGLE